MELQAHDLLPAHGHGEGFIGRVVDPRHGHAVFVRRVEDIAVVEEHRLAVAGAQQRLAAHHFQAVPADVPACRGQRLHLARDQAQAHRVAVFAGAVRQQLHAQADADDGLAASRLGLDQFDQAQAVQGLHRRRKGAHAGQHHHVGRGQGFGVAADAAAVAQPAQAARHRRQVAGAVVDDAGGDAATAHAATAASRKPTPTSKRLWMLPSAWMSNSLRLVAARTCSQKATTVMPR